MTRDEACTNPVSLRWDVALLLVDQDSAPTHLLVVMLLPLPQKRPELSFITLEHFTASLTPSAFPVSPSGNEVLTPWQEPKESGSTPSHTRNPGALEVVSFSSVRSTAPGNSSRDVLTRRDYPAGQSKLRAGYWAWPYPPILW